MIMNEFNEFDIESVQIIFWLVNERLEIMNRMNRIINI